MNEETEDIVTAPNLQPGGELAESYCAFFDHFNQQEFFEAHTVLEGHWHQKRGHPDADFFKGLIQLAGAFVHVQRERRILAMALFKLAGATPGKYPDRHLHVDMLPFVGNRSRTPISASVRDMNPHAKMSWRTLPCTSVRRRSMPL